MRFGKATLFVELCALGAVISGCGSEPAKPTAPSGMAALIAGQSTVDGDLYALVNEEKIQELFTSNQFGKLEAIAARLRDERTKTIDDEWLLGYFYGAIVNPYENREQEKQFLSLMSAWRNAFPDSNVRRIAMARAFIDFGWRERGGEYAYKVSRGQWNLFHDYLTKAWKQLEPIDAAKDYLPEVYPLRLSIVRGLGGTPENNSGFAAMMDAFKERFTGQPSDRTEADAIFEEGMAVEPTYYALYRRRASALVRQWGGAPGAMERFAEDIANRTKDTLGEGLYARTAVTALVTQGSGRYKQEFAFDWNRIQQGIADLKKQAPNSRFWPQVYVWLACLHEDKAKAAEGFTAIGDAYDTYTWKNEHRYRLWRAWALEDHPYPVNPGLEQAFIYNDLQEFQRIVATEKPDLDIVRENGLSFLHAATRSNELPWIRLLLDLGADPHVKDDEGWDAVNAAIDMASPEALDLILSAGGNPESLSPGSKEAPLRRALHYGKYDHAPLLIKHGGDVEMRNPLGWTAMHGAADKGDLRAAQILVDMGADINAVMPENSWTPLHIAVKRGHTEMVKFLLENGADTTLRLDSGRSPLNLAVRDGQQEIAQIIREFNATQDAERASQD